MKVSDFDSLQHFKKYLFDKYCIRMQYSVSGRRDTCYLSCVGRMPVSTKRLYGKDWKELIEKVIDYIEYYVDNSQMCKNNNLFYRKKLI